MSALPPPTQQHNKFVGKKIENTLSFNIITPSVQPSSGESQTLKVNQAVPLGFAIPQKKLLTKNGVGNYNQSSFPHPDKSKSKTKIRNIHLLSGGQQGNGQSSGFTSQKHLDNSMKKDEDEPQLMQVYQQIPLSLQERRQQKKMEQNKGGESNFLRKDIQVIQQETTLSNLSSDHEDCVDIMISKKNQKQLQSQQQPFPTQNDEFDEKEAKKQADIDEMIRRSNIKYKIDKEMQESQKNQRQLEAQRLKEKLKKQEEEIRRRNQQKTQQYKEKKKKIEKEKQDSIILNEQRRKSMTKQSCKSQSNNQQTMMNTSSEINPTSARTDLSKEQFDLATKNRVKELMRKQKDEKDRLDEEKERKRQKLELLRQEQLVQLQKAKIKTKEQEEEERKTYVVKRPGGGGSAQPVYFQSERRDERRDSRSLLNNQKESHNLSYASQDEETQQLDDSLQKKAIQRIQIQKKNQKSSLNIHPDEKIMKNPSMYEDIVENNVSDSFLKDNIHKSIKQLYPECSLEELLKLEEEYRKEFVKETKKEKKFIQNKIKSQSHQKSSASSSKKNKSSFSQLNKVKNQQLEENKNELTKIMQLQKLETIDVNSVKNPAEMIENLRNLAEKIEQDIDSNDQKFGIGKYKKKNIKSDDQSASSTTKMKEEIAKLEKEAYLKELYLNAHNFFSPEEMNDFDVYMQSHLIDGDIEFTSDEEENLQDDADNKSELDREDNAAKISKDRQQYARQLKRTNQKSIKELHQNSGAQRGKSIDLRPKSCLIKKVKQKRSKTVTFDSLCASSKTNILNLQIQQDSHLNKEKNDSNNFDNFNDIEAERFSNEYNKENQQESGNLGIKEMRKNSNQQIRANQPLINDKARFDKKVQEVKELVLQYSGEKPKQLDLSIPSNSLENSSVNQNLRLSHLKSQNIPNIRSTSNKQAPYKVTPKVKSKQLLTVDLNNQKQVLQRLQEVPPSLPGQEMLSSPQEMANIPSDFESDFLNFNQKFDFDIFQNKMSQEDLKSLINVENLDLKSFFTNERLNEVQRIQGQQISPLLENHMLNEYDEEDEGLFAEDAGSQIYQYYENNRENIQSGEKGNNNSNNTVILQLQLQQQIGGSQQKNNFLSESNDSEFNREFLDDDKLFALSATDLLKLASATNHGKFLS